MAEILDRNGLNVDTSPLYRAAIQCEHDPCEAGVWSYELSRLIFRPEQLRRSIPAGVDNPMIDLSVEVEGLCNLPSEGGHDPFHRYQLELQVGGTMPTATGGDRRLIASWHLDRDSPEPGDGRQRYAHPIYHLQFGGRTMRDSAMDFGAVVIADAPRIAHPPMDAILAIDWVITNYFAATEIEFRSEREYADLVASASARVLRPYVHAFATIWLDGGSVSDLGLRIWPQLAM